ncbi:MAG: porin family protein [Bacteroidota bacterium]|nr:porin family protein [Bacteroidota bacterium]
MRFQKILKPFALLVIVLILAPSVNAQGWNLGLDGGLNISSIKLVDKADHVTGEFSPRMGLHLSIFGEYGFSERWFVQLWLSYDARGAKYKDSYITQSGQQYSNDLALRSNYFSLPVLMKYVLPASEKLDFYGQFGPGFSYLGWAKVKGTETLDGSTSEINERLGDTWTKVTTSLIFGIGMEFNHTEHGSTFVQVQYNLGLSDVHRQGFYYDQNNSDPDARSHVITITVGAKGKVGD